MTKGLGLESRKTVLIYIALLPLPRNPAVSQQADGGMNPTLNPGESLNVLKSLPGQAVRAKNGWN